MECLDCGHKYMANGCDVWLRKCPKCYPVKENKALVIQTDRKKITSRKISDKLRYKVMKRDNFKCCICGSSPAKDPSIELHIDHIVPWSKGGETIIDNLQNLCSRCNLGKGDSD